MRRITCLTLAVALLCGTSVLAADPKPVHPGPKPGHQHHGGDHRAGHDHHDRHHDHRGHGHWRHHPKYGWYWSEEYAEPVVPVTPEVEVVPGTPEVMPGYPQIQPGYPELEVPVPPVAPPVTQYYYPVPYGAYPVYPPYVYPYGGAAPGWYGSRYWNGRSWGSSHHHHHPEHHHHK